MRQEGNNNMVARSLDLIPSPDIIRNLVKVPLNQMKNLQCGSP